MIDIILFVMVLVLAYYLNDTRAEILFLQRAQIKTNKAVIELLDKLSR